MPETTDRPQDVGRGHHRKPAAEPESAPVLEAYRAAMRLELEGLIVEIRGPAGEQLGMDGVARSVRPSLDVRRALWDLAIKLGRELAAGVDQDPPPQGISAERVRGSTSAARAPRLTARERRSLGG